MGVAAVGSQNALSRYWALLGLEGEIDVETLDATYYMIAERFPKDPTEDEQQRIHELRHAYSVLRSACTSKASDRPVRSTGERSKRRPLLLAAMLVSALAVLAVMNLGALRSAFVTYRPGDVVHFHGKSDPYGTVLSFERSHSFGIGAPTAAYQIRRPNGEEVWLSARVVERGMQRRK